jgi:hypothetical protein
MESFVLKCVCYILYLYALGVHCRAENYRYNEIRTRGKYVLSYFAYNVAYELIPKPSGACYVVRCRFHVSNRCVLCG